MPPILKPWLEAYLPWGLSICTGSCLLVPCWDVLVFSLLYRKSLIRTTMHPWLESYPLRPKELICLCFFSHRADSRVIPRNYKRVNPPLLPPTAGGPLLHFQAVLRNTTALSLREVPSNSARGEGTTLTLFNTWNCGIHELNWIFRVIEALFFFFFLKAGKTEAESRRNLPKFLLLKWSLNNQHAIAGEGWAVHRFLKDNSLFNF